MRHRAGFMEQTHQLDNLYLLVKVIEAGSLAAAARELGTTRSLVSRRLIALEKAFGTRLIHRDARRFAVTAAGEQVYKHAVVMCDAADAAFAAVREARAPGQGTLRVGMHDTLSTFVSGMLTAYAGQHPHLRIATSTRDDVDALLKQRVDAIMHLGRDLPDNGDIVARPLGEVRRVIVANPTLYEHLGRPQSPDAIDASQRLLFTGFGHDPTWALPGGAAKPHSARLASTHLGTVLNAARAGMGFARLPLFACEQDLAAGRLVAVLEAFEPPPEPLHALTLSGEACHATTHDFVGFACNRMQDAGAPQGETL